MHVSETGRRVASLPGVPAGRRFFFAPALEVAIWSDDRNGSGGAAVVSGGGKAAGAQELNMVAGRRRTTPPPSLSFFYLSRPPARSIYR